MQDNTAALQQDPNDVTRNRRLALDAAREYYRLSREHWNNGTHNNNEDAQTFALQGILRLMIYQVGGDDQGHVQPQ